MITATSMATTTFTSVARRSRRRSDARADASSSLLARVGIVEVDHLVRRKDARLDEVPLFVGQLRLAEAERLGALGREDDVHGRCGLRDDRCFRLRDEASR